MESQPRIWWIPTGPLCALPIHAAGKHRNSTCSLDMVLSWAVLSYCPSIKALFYTYTNKNQKKRSKGPENFVFVSMEKMNGCTNLPFAQSEVEKPFPLLLPSIPRIVMNKPQKDEVLDVFKRSAIFDFAGHGESPQRDPLKSFLLAADWPDNLLTVEDLISLKLHQSPPFLAYLFVCSTGNNKVDKLVDESIHLMSVCRFAGFQHVIGSLWEVSNEHCMTVATDVYQKMLFSDLSSRFVSYGLHSAAKSLRDYPNRIIKARDDRNVYVETEDSSEIEMGDPRIWAAYIHIGI